MKRTDNLQENSIVTRLKADRLAFDAIKTSQRAGSSNVNIRRIINSSDPSWVDFTTTIAYHQLRIFELTITPAAGTASNGLFVWRIFFNVITTTGTGTTQTNADVFPADANGVRKARVYILGTTPSTSVTYGMRVVLYTIGQATFSIAQIQ